MVRALAPSIRPGRAASSAHAIETHHAHEEEEDGAEVRVVRAVEELGDVVVVPVVVPRLEKLEPVRVQCADRLHAPAMPARRADVSVYRVLSTPMYCAAAPWTGRGSWPGPTGPASRSCSCSESTGRRATATGRCSSALLIRIKDPRPGKRLSAVTRSLREHVPARVLSCIRYSKLEIWCVCHSSVSCDFFAHWRIVVPMTVLESVCPRSDSGLIEFCRTRTNLMT